MAYETYEDAIKGLNDLVTQMRKENLDKKAVAKKLAEWLDDDNNFPDTQASNDIIIEFRDRLNSKIHVEQRKSGNFFSILGDVSNSSLFDIDNSIYLDKLLTDTSVKSFFVNKMVHTINEQFEMEDTQSLESGTDVESEPESSEPSEDEPEVVLVSDEDFRDEAVKLNVALHKKLKEEELKIDKIKYILDKIKENPKEAENYDLDEMSENLENAINSRKLIMDIQKEAQPFMIKREYGEAVNVYQKYFAAEKLTSAPVVEKEEELNPIARAILGGGVMPEEDPAFVPQIVPLTRPSLVDVSFRNATPLQKTNKIIEQGLELLKQGSNLDKEGIFRLSSEVGLLKSAFEKANKDPAVKLSESCGDFIQDPINIATLMKKAMQDVPEWQGRPQEILRNFINEKPIVPEGSTGDPKRDFKKCIDALLAEGFHEEAKFLHNILHMSQMVASHSNTNRMKEFNMAVIIAPVLDKLAKIEPKTIKEAATMGLAASVLMVTDDPFNMKAFTQTFDDAYPNTAVALAHEYAKLPQHVPEVIPETRPETTPAVQPKKGLFTRAVDWVVENIGKPIKSAFGFVASGFGLFAKKPEEKDPVISAPIRKETTVHTVPVAPQPEMKPKTPKETRPAPVVPLREQSAHSVPIQPAPKVELSEEQVKVKEQVQECISTLIEDMKIQFYKDERENQLKSPQDAVNLLRKLQSVNINKLPPYVTKQETDQGNFPRVVATIIENLQSKVDLLESRGRTITKTDIDTLFNQVSFMFNKDLPNPLKDLKEKMDQLAEEQKSTAKMER